MIHWESGYVDANGLRLHDTRTGRGAGRPPLVLAHGISDDGPCWTPVDAARHRSLIPGIRLAHIPDAGHCIRRDQPAAYLATVRAFLATVSSTPANATG